jgi:hypothetical protein
LTHDETSRRDLGTTIYRLGKIEEATGQADAACSSFRRARRLYELNVPQKGETHFHDWRAIEYATGECDAGRKTG